MLPPQNAVHEYTINGLGARPSTRDLLLAIRAHRSGGATSGDASEGNTVIGQFEALPKSGKRDVLNFLRSL